MSTPKGRLIAFEGIDGSGKSSQLEILASLLTSRGLDVVSTRQPTSAYRDAPEVRAYLDNGNASVGMERLCQLAAVDRRQHLDSVVLPNLEQGRWVLCDRYVYSSYAFFQARGVDVSLVRRLNPGVRIPDITFLLDIEPAEARRRVLAREGSISKFEERNIGYMSLVRNYYLNTRDESFVVVDAARPVEIVSMWIRAAVESLRPNPEPDFQESVEV